MRDTVSRMLAIGTRASGFSFQEDTSTRSIDESLVTDSLMAAWQCELESGAPSGVGAGPQVAAMRLDDPAADGQPHAGSTRLGGEKRVENALRASFGKPNPGIAHGNKQLTILSPHRGDVQFADLLLHGLDAIEHEIHQNLLQLHAVRTRCRKRRVELTADGNGMAISNIAQQNDHLADDLV